MYKYLFLILFLLFEPSLFANDSTATVGAGGVVLEKTDGIVMQVEDLYLSPSKVKVHYIFENQSNQDIKTTVAFPLPAIDNEEGDVSIDLQQENPMNFKVLVDHRPIKFRIERKKIEPNKVKFTYYWSQVFPKGKKIEVEHTYRPGVGNYLLNPGRDPSGVLSSEKTYCVDPPLKKWIEENSKQTGGIASIRELVYILSTGSHWKGSIRDFHLIVDKEKPERKISFCMKGIRQISSTRFEVRKKYFIPHQDLRIAIFEPFKE